MVAFIVAAAAATPPGNEHPIGSRARVLSGVRTHGGRRERKNELVDFSASGTTTKGGKAGAREREREHVTKE